MAKNLLGTEIQQHIWGCGCAVRTDIVAFVCAVESTVKTEDVQCIQRIFSNNNS